MKTIHDNKEKLEFPFKIELENGEHIYITREQAFEAYKKAKDIACTKEIKPNLLQRIMRWLGITPPPPKTNKEQHINNIVL